MFGGVVCFCYLLRGDLLRKYTDAIKGMSGSRVLEATTMGKPTMLTGTTADTVGSM